VCAQRRMEDFTLTGEKGGRAQLYGGAGERNRASRKRRCVESPTIVTMDGKVGDGGGHAGRPPPHTARAAYDINVIGLRT